MQIINYTIRKKWHERSPYKEILEALTFVAMIAVFFLAMIVL